MDWDKIWASLSSLLAAAIPKVSAWYILFVMFNNKDHCNSVIMLLRLALCPRPIVEICLRAKIMSLLIYKILKLWGGSKIRIRSRWPTNLETVGLGTVCAYAPLSFNSQSIRRTSFVRKSLQKLKNRGECEHYALGLLLKSVLEQKLWAC